MFFSKCARREYARNAAFNDGARAWLLKLVGNGASCEAFEAVTAGKWYALYNLDTVSMGYESVILGSEIANGGTPAMVNNSQELRDPKGTADVIAGYECAYSDLG